MRAWWFVKSVWWQFAYWIRPYDMLADQRRWFWQPGQPCQFQQPYPSRDRGEC